jgi:hypothetical protein
LGSNGGEYEGDSGDELGSNGGEYEGDSGLYEGERGMAWEDLPESKKVYPLIGNYK